MGQAKSRGTFEQRRDIAMQREQERINAIEAARRLRYQQEIDAYSIMVWWQIEMSERRHKYIIQKQMESQLAWVQLMGMLHGMSWDSMLPIFNSCHQNNGG